MPSGREYSYAVDGHPVAGVQGEERDVAADLAADTRERRSASATAAHGSERRAVSHAAPSAAASAVVVPTM